MPRTGFQKAVFMVLTVLVSVTCFAIYNVALSLGAMSNRVFSLALREVPAKFAIALLLEALVVYRLAQRMAFRYVDPRRDRPIVIVLAITATTICLMCPVMSLASTMLHHGFGPELAAQWCRALAWNFPFAFFSQVFFIGPLVRGVCRTIFPAGGPVVASEAAQASSS
jgi:hypothetical protein